MAGALASAGGGQARSRDHCSRPPAEMSSCVYIEHRIYRTFLIGPLDFDIMRFICTLVYLLRLDEEQLITGVILHYMTVVNCALCLG